MAGVSATGRDGYTGELWRFIEGIYAEILAHLFLQGLTDGTLAKDRFRFYVVHSHHTRPTQREPAAPRSRWGRGTGPGESVVKYYVAVSGG